MEQRLELNYKEQIDFLTSKRDIELEKLVNMLKSNSDRLRIENQFETLMKEQNQLSLTIGGYRVFVNSRYGK
jgi:mRNA-degrading endonuclease RelE of RelBE toxin-antitoxin system